MASEVFITRRSKSPSITGELIHRIYYQSITNSDQPHTPTLFGYTNKNFTVPNHIAQNAIQVFTVGCGGNALEVYDSSSTRFALCGGGSGWVNAHLFKNELTPGQIITISSGSGGTVSFGTYLSANKGGTGRVNYTAVEAWGGNGGAGGGCYAFGYTAKGGRGYQFGGGGGLDYGGDGGVWGGGGAGKVKGGNGGTYGGGGGSLTTGGTGGTYGGNAGAKGTDKPASTYNAEFNVITTTGTISTHYGVEARTSTHAYTGNINIGGGGYGGRALSISRRSNSGETCLLGGAGFSSDTPIARTSDAQYNWIGGGSGYHTPSSAYVPIPGTYTRGAKDDMIVFGGATCFDSYPIIYQFSKTDYMESPIIKSFSISPSYLFGSESSRSMNNIYVVTGGSGTAGPDSIHWNSSISSDSATVPVGFGAGGSAYFVIPNTQSITIKSIFNITNLSYISETFTPTSGCVYIRYYQYI